MTDTGSGSTRDTLAEHHQHAAEMVAYYASTAGKYNTWHGNLHVRCSHNFAASQLVSLVKSKGYKSVLDVCCGTGRAVKACLEHGIDAHGVDISQQLIDEGVKQWGLPVGAFTCADAAELPFPDNHFDTSCILGALHHSAVPERIMKEMIRVTKHAVVISDEGNHINGGIKKILIKLGIFNVVYRLVFRRAPRTARGTTLSLEDGPAYVFSVEEVMPLLESRFRDIKTYQFYRMGRFQIASPHLPRLIARQIVLIADSKR